MSWGDGSSTGLCIPEFEDWIVIFMFLCLCLFVPNSCVMRYPWLRLEGQEWYWKLTSVTQNLNTGLFFKLLVTFRIHLFLSFCPNLTFVMRYPQLKLEDGSDTGNWGLWLRTQNCFVSVFFPNLNFGMRYMYPWLRLEGGSNTGSRDLWPRIWRLFSLQIA